MTWRCRRSRGRTCESGLPGRQVVFRQAGIGAAEREVQREAMRVLVAIDNQLTDAGAEGAEVLGGKDAGRRGKRARWAARRKSAGCTPRRPAIRGQPCTSGERPPGGPHDFGEKRGQFLDTIEVDQFARDGEARAFEPDGAVELGLHVRRQDVEFRQSLVGQLVAAVFAVPLSLQTELA